MAVPAGSEGRVPDAAVAVAGGASRSESVAAGLRRVESELVAVHDAARPLVTAKLIDELVAKLLDRPDAAAVIAAAPIMDTVKRAGEPRPAGGAYDVAETMNRDELWAVQTPQVFRTAALREALETKPERIAAATDDAMLVEEAGGKVLLYPSSPENLKVTTPLDLRIAELLIAERRRVKVAWALMPRRASIAIATAALLGVALAGQAIAGDGTVGQKVTIARGKFAHHSWSLGVQGRHRQRCYVLSLSAAGSASAGGTCRSDVRRPPLWKRVLGVSDDNATAELNVTRTRVRSMKLRIGHPRFEPAIGVGPRAHQTHHPPPG